MPPSTLQLTAQLRLMIYYHLDNELLYNALILAGRMHAFDQKNPEAVHLLSLCHFKNKQYKLAFDYGQPVARRSLHLGCSYVFAQACLKLNRSPEGIDALERTRHMWDGKNDWVKTPDTTQRFIPDAPAVLCLLGKLYRAEWRTDKAVECWAAALKLNPFMWEAFENLCDTGANLKTSNVFKLNPDLEAILSARSDRSTQPTDDTHHAPQSTSQLPSTRSEAIIKNEPDPFSSRGGPSSTQSSMLSSFRMPDARPRPPHVPSSDVMDMIDTPTALPQTTLAPTHPHEPSRIGHYHEPPAAPLRKPRSQASNIEISADPTKPRSLSSRTRTKSVSEDGEPAHPTALHKRTISGNVPHPPPSNANDLHIRRSRRLLNTTRPINSKPPTISSIADDREPNEPPKIRATGTKGRPTATTSTVGRVVSGNRKPMSHDTSNKEKRLESHPVEGRSRVERSAVIQSTSSSSGLETVECIQWLLNLLARLGQGYYCLSQYDPQAALKCFHDIPNAQRDTPWVLARIGKCYFEQNSYDDAAKAFARVRKIAPSSVADMEVYSTILWHEKHETELAFLSHELLDIDRSSPEAWCTIGNAFSLQRDHDQALKCFKRATQLDPRFAYGYTLQGHEHIVNEKFDDALAAYRRAVSVDQRHYNGWYGLGKVYEKLGQVTMAEKHYRAAASINPKNAVLYCCIGYIMEKRKQPDLALQQYDYASQLQPLASQALFRKARLLLTLRKHEQAISALNRLKDIAPNESNVHYMLGRAYARLHNKGLAVKHYTNAMNLDPKAAPYLKEQMEALDEDYDEDDEDEDDSMTM